ncbi:MAG: class I SAM-dependent methyltransferase [Acidobacteria bacterium]|nr:class I SAM-dependent methyltransferase [Acidobacteriota bacterium]
MPDLAEYDRPHAVAELYDWVPAYVARPDVPFYLELCSSAQGPVLELGCGTGRILIPAATAGRMVVGLDSSVRMLAVCRQKLLAEPVEVQERAELISASMTDFDLGRVFSLVTAPFRAFQHLLSPGEQLACFRCANRHLPIGGTLAFDVFHADLSDLIEPTNEQEKVEFWGVELPGGRTLKRSHRIAGVHRAEQYNDVELIYYVTWPDGREERMVHAFPMRYFFRYEVEHLLARCGFEVIQLFGDFNRSPYNDASPEMIFIAAKCRDLVP